MSQEHPIPEDIHNIYACKLCWPWKRYQSRGYDEAEAHLYNTHKAGPYYNLFREERLIKQKQVGSCKIRFRDGVDGEHLCSLAKGHQERHYCNLDGHQCYEG